MNFIAAQQYLQKTPNGRPIALASELLISSKQGTVPWYFTWPTLYPYTGDLRKVLLNFAIWCVELCTKTRSPDWMISFDKNPYYPLYGDKEFEDKAAMKLMYEVHNAHQ